MTRILTIALIFLTCTQLNAQTHEECGTDQRHKLLMENDPAYKAEFEKYQQEMRAALRSPNTRTGAATYKVPIVVHVLHKGTAVGVAENISDEQIYSAIYYLNKAYAHTAPYNQGTQGVDLGMEFCLVQKDASGNPTTGIDRVDMSLDTDYMTNGMTSANEGTLKTAIKWNTAKYYNIYIVSEIDGNSGSGVQGYAYYPTTFYKDGAVILFNAFGYDPGGKNGYTLKSFTQYNITATHEIGHAFNLYHTFQGDGTGSTCPTDLDCTAEGDMVCDTPPHKRTSSTCGPATNSCTGGPNSEYIHNFMDYSGEMCKYEFTAGQAARVQAALTTSPSRMSLVNASNITACGCDGDLPVVRYKASKTTPCLNETITFTDNSIDFPTTWNWTFPGGNPSASTSQNPTVTYAAPGSYDVSLTVNSAQNGGRTLTKNGYIVINNAQALPIAQDFSTAWPGTGWTITNPDASTTWYLASTSNPSNNAARVPNNSYSSIGQIDMLSTPYLDLTGGSLPILTFRVAHKSGAGPVYDTLKVIVSNDCSGMGGVEVYNKYGLALQTSTIGTGYFTPASSADWRTETVDLSAFAGQYLYVTFKNITAHGNNTYIDDISITTSGVTATQSAIAEANLYVYPNPANSTLFTVADASRFEKVQIVNMQGEVMQEQPVSLGAVDISGLTSGVYLARFIGDQNVGIRRFTIVR